jgi:hypothetical protein
MTGYHDYVLGLIPTLVLGPIAFSSFVGLPVRVAVGVGGAAAALLVGHAMFVRGPVTRVAADDGVTQSAVGSAVSGEPSSGSGPGESSSGSLTGESSGSFAGGSSGSLAGKSAGGVAPSDD